MVVDEASGAGVRKPANGLSDAGVGEPGDAPCRTLQEDRPKMGPIAALPAGGTFARSGAIGLMNGTLRSTAPYVDDGSTIFKALNPCLS